MKTPISILLGLLLLTGPLLGLEIKSNPQSLPAEIHLKSGRVIKNFTVLRWESDKVIVKHAGGAEPIPFSLITNVPAKKLMAISSDQRARADEEKRSADGYRRAIQADADAERDTKLKKLREAGAIKGNLTIDASWSGMLATIKVTNTGTGGSETFEWRQLEAVFESGKRVEPTDIQIVTGDRLNYSVPAGDTRSFQVAFGKTDYQDRIAAIRWK